MTKLWLAVGGALAVVVAAALGAVAFTRDGDPVHRPAARPTVRVTAGPATTPYAQAVDAAHRRGLRVWIETDLVKRWKAGPESFDDAVATVADLAARPGVVGIKIADEMGYDDGLSTPRKVRAFLHDSAVALRRAAPGKRILVDLVVPELGCLPDHDPPLRWATICAVQARGAHPQLALDQVDEYLRSGDIDLIDLSTGLLPNKTYAGWGVDPDEAQRTAWQEVARRGWDRQVQVQARKALAHPDDYTGDVAEASRDVRTFVDLPRAAGAGAVDVWTWRQRYEGQVYRLMDPGLRNNALWKVLRQRRAAGARLFTHLSPHSVEVGLTEDLGVLSQVFTDVFIAAGTG